MRAAASTLLTGARPAATSSGPASAKRKVDHFLAGEQSEVARAGCTLKADAPSFARFHEQPAPNGIAVLLHGFSAGTKQWEHQVDDLYQRGYDVFVPRLPGHSEVRADGQVDTERVPSQYGEQWEAFGDKIWDLVKDSGKVSLVGLSAGGMLALRTAERHRDERTSEGEQVLQKVVAVSPFLAPAGDLFRASGVGISNRNAIWFASLAHAAAPGLVTPLLRLAYKDLSAENATPYDYGFRYARHDQVLALGRAGEATLADAEKLRGTQTLVVLSEADTLADPAVAREAAEAAEAETVIFPLSEGVPHGMISPRENPDPVSCSRVQNLINEHLAG
jgi:pimeloyl-ACP methyl ester carboxylesterase